ncbi:hypothetical protein C8F04DRAFT_1393862 [Mycena alexandri]|uniref:Uncharacterized protein n=1 Tax=Mycena alexandri TaxID=1745969 RepID=A0AAD6T0D7_9AGAR|nr:hypothetical protein C8F04DRAFT_1393862 [Mycena alexandri]
MGSTARWRRHLVLNSSSLPHFYIDPSLDPRALVWPILNLMGTYSLISPSRPTGGSQSKTQGAVPITGRDGASFAMDWSTGSWGTGWPCDFGPFGCGPFSAASTPSPSRSSSSDAMSSSTSTSATTLSSPTSSRNLFAIGSPGFTGVIVAGGLVLLVVGIFLGRCMLRHRGQTKDPEMHDAEFSTQSRATTESQLSSYNEAALLRPPARNQRMNEPEVLESQFLASVLGPPSSGSATYPVANSRTRIDSSLRESYFLPESPPSDWGQQAGPATQPLGSARRPVRELSIDSQPSGSTTYAGSNRDASPV